MLAKVFGAGDAVGAVVVVGGRCEEHFGVALIIFKVPILNILVLLEPIQLRVQATIQLVIMVFLVEVVQDLLLLICALVVILWGGVDPLILPF